MKSSETSPLLLNCEFPTRTEYVQRIAAALSKDTLTHIVTLNAEMVVEAERNSEFREAVQKAELKIPDGSSMLWAKKYLAQRHPCPRVGIQTRPASWRGGFRVKPGMTSYIHLLFSLIKHLFSKEQPLTGVDSIFDICEIAEKKNGSVYLLGGTPHEAQKTAEILQKKISQSGKILAMDFDVKKITQEYVKIYSEVINVREIK